MSEHAPSGIMVRVVPDCYATRSFVIWTFWVFLFFFFFLCRVPSLRTFFEFPKKKMTKMISGKIFRWNKKQKDATRNLVSRNSQMFHPRLEKTELERRNKMLVKQFLCHSSICRVRPLRQLWNSLPEKKKEIKRKAFSVQAAHVIFLPPSRVTAAVAAVLP